MDQILVAVRFKPQKSDPDQKNPDPWRVYQHPDNVIFNLRNKQNYNFSLVFGQDSTNTEIFSLVAEPLLQSFLEGINSSIFAYGQTSSGKTFTIRGTQSNPGLIIQSISHVFVYKQLNPNIQIKISYLEVYNEQINDLLDPSLKNLEIREHPEKGIYVEKLSEYCVETEEKALELLYNGESLRKTGETQMNAFSSRSHSVFKISVDIISQFFIKTSQMCFIDLAGSEGVQKAKTEDLRLKEGSNINKSLLYLSNVIQQLSEGKNFVNFRASKLTRLLQPYLSGNFKTAVICTVNPEGEYYHESKNTLSFGIKAKLIKNEAKVNCIVMNEIKLEEIGEEIKRLTEKNLELERNFETISDKVKEKEVKEIYYELEINQKDNIIKELSHEIEKNRIFADEQEARFQRASFEFVEFKSENLKIIDGLGMQIRVLKNEYEKLQRELEKCFEEKSCTEKQLADRLNDIEVLIEQNIEGRKKTEEKNLEISELKKKIEEIVQVNSKILLEKQVAEEAARRLEQEIRAKASQILQFEEELKRLHENLVTIYKEKIDCDLKVQKTSEEISNKTSENQELSKKLNESESKIKNLESQLEEEKSANINLSQLIESFKLDTSSLKLKEIELNNKLLELNEDLQTAQASLKNSNILLENLGREFSNSIFLKETEIKSQSQEISEKNKIIEELKKPAKEYLEKLEENLNLQTHLGLLESLLNEKENKIKALTEFLEEYQSQFYSSKSAASSNLTTIKTQQEQLDSFSRNQGILENRISQLVKEIEKKQSKNSALILEVIALENCLKESKTSSFKQSENSHFSEASQITSLKEEIQSLKQKISTLEESLKTAEEEKIILSEELSNFTLKLNESESDKLKIRFYEKILPELKNSKDPPPLILFKEVENLEKKIRKIKEKNEKLEGLNEVIKEQSVKINKLSEENEDLLQSNAEYKEKIKDLNKVITKKRVSLGELSRNTISTSNETELVRKYKEALAIMQSEKSELFNTVEGLKSEKGLLTQKNSNLELQNTSLITEKLRLSENCSELFKETEKLKNQIQSLREDKEALLYSPENADEFYRRLKDNQSCTNQ